MKKKSIIISIVVIVAALVLFMLFGTGRSGGEEGYKLVEIKKGSIENLVSSTGTLSALETVEVGSQVSGIITKLYVDFNSSVKKGQLLAVLDKTLFLVSVNDKEASLSRSRATLNRANAEVRRNQPLYEKGHISGAEFLVIKTDAEKAVADLQISAAALKRAKTNLEYSEIRSPIDGTVIERTIDEGQTIAASFQAPKLFVVAEDLTRMQIEAKVDESDIGQIKQGQEVRFSVQAYSEKIFTGKVRQIRLQPETIQNVVNYTVIVDAPNNNRLLLPGMTATVDFLIEDVNDVLLISNKAFSFSPPMEEMRKIFQKMSSGGKGSGQGGRSGMNPFGGNTSGGPGGFKMPEDIGRVFYVDKDNNLAMSIFKKGVTDGINTEVKSVIRGELVSGSKVITGIEKVKKKTNSGSKNTLLPSPGSGRR
ncbi:MAG: efflux RND transporter periplasmic adaptor subunit [Candidatus Aminicenantes bacterium]|nr:efflux RND transporter periplasmic adaptor subunit [Candidatus Aminicenantes bacterium]